MGACVSLEGDAQLMQVARASRPPRRFSDALDSRQNHCKQDREDRDRYYDFDDREAVTRNRAVMCRALHEIAMGEQFSDDGRLLGLSDLSS